LFAGVSVQPMPIAAAGSVPRAKKCKSCQHPSSKWTKFSKLFSFIQRLPTCTIYFFAAHAHSIKIKNLDNKIKMRKSFYFHTNFKILFKTQNKNLKYNLATQAVFGIYPTNLWTSTNR
jgi:hypothetical protein